jgi:hypothetical protein
MAKKFELGKTLGNPTPSFSVETIEEMTKKIHDKEKITPDVVLKENPKKEKVIKITPKQESKPAIREKIITPAVQQSPSEPAKRGRKPNAPASDERMIRVSVDLPESVFIKLKTKVIQDRTDMKTFVWRLVETTLQ